MGKYGKTIFRIFLWLILIWIVGWLLYMAIVPGGKISYSCDFITGECDDYFIGKLTPEDRMIFSEDGIQKIIGDPIYFNLRTPRRFDSAKLILKYKNENDLPLIESGVLADKKIWRYDLKPIENRIIDQVSLVWDVIREDYIILLQRERKYNNIEEFFSNLPNRNEIALYNYDLKTEFLIEDYESKKDKTINIPSLRGAWQAYVYIKDEEMDFDFSFSDLNKNDDSDAIDLHLYYDNRLIDSWHIDDNDEDNERGLKINLASLPEGIYKLELRVNDDVITENFNTKQNKLSFINKIWIADNENENINLFTDGGIVQAQTTNPAKLQKIDITSASSVQVNKKLDINKTYKQFSSKTEDLISGIKLEKNDIILAGDGMFSFSKESLINPNFKKVNSNLDINKNGINYVLANYKIPGKDKDWKIASAEFNLSNAYREDGNYSFLISIPGLRADYEIEDFIEVGGIEVELCGKSLSEKIREIFK
ncbi:MAG: hypothetical protein ABIA02_00370 [Candidatus Falkowbacteria bacterium]